jgi:hypothetical protein
MFSRFWTTYLTLGRTFGVWIRPPIVAYLFVFLRINVWFFMMLDNLFYPKLRKTEVKSPIVLVGNPRTGTTFLQRWLSDHGVGTGMPLYGMLYPSLLLRAVLKPFLPILEKLSPAKYHNTAAHETSLGSVETDDVGVLFRYFDGFFLYGFFLAWAEEDLQSMVDPKVRDTSKRDFDWLEKIWARNLVATGQNRVVAKLFSLGPRMPQFLARYPEAKILYMARDPIDIMPSGMSLVTGVLDRAFGFWSQPEEKRNRYLNRLYDAFVLLLRRFTDDWVSGTIPHDRVFVVRYDEMMGNFDTMMPALLDFVGHPVDDELKAEIATRAAKQRAYKSGHKYDLAKFGLDADKIRRDCGFFYETFLPGLLEAQAAADDAAPTQNTSA